MKLAGKIGFVGGGLMAEALIKGVIHAGLVEPGQALVADPSAERRQHLQKVYAVEVYENAEAVFKACKIVILAVKPQIIAKVLEQYRSLVDSSHLVISIAAGIPIAVLERCLGGSGCRIVRVMPNTPAIVQQGASALSAGSGATQEDIAIAKGIFDAIGTSVVLDESLLDAVTGLSGSGPAYVFSFLEALIDGGVKVGLARPVAETLALQTVLGAVKLAMETKEHPAQLRAMVTSPGGTTIAGLHELEKGALRAIVMNAVEAATCRAVELGRMVEEKQQK